MKLNFLATLFFLLPLAVMAQLDPTTKTKVGDPIPQFIFEIERGKKVNISDYRGKLILINLFATWCPPCNTELPLVQKQIWEKHSGNPGFAFFVFGREEGWDKLEPYKKAKGFTFPILPDTDRSIFMKFATQSIPRNILIDQNGRIIYQSIGYSEKDFAEMVSLINKQLEKQTSGK